MKYEFVPYDKTRYATNLQRTFGNEGVKWDSSPSQDVLIIRSTFGQPVISEKEEIANALSALRGLPEGEFVHLYDNVYARYVSAREFAQNNGCAIQGVGCRYTVFAFRRNLETDTGLIYESSNQIMIKNYCDVTVNATVSVTRHVETRGLFKRKIETEFLAISVSDNVLSGYTDGDIFYTLRNIEIPVTGEMISRGVFYVKSEELPEFGVKNPGIELSIQR